MECGGNSWDGAGPAAESYLQCPMGMKFPGQGSPEVRVINFYDFEISKGPSLIVEKVQFQLVCSCLIMLNKFY